MYNKIPLISIIVPTYNQEKFIGRCLRSLLHQTMPVSDYEIIVINDGSTDRTSYALELFYDAIIPIDNIQNIGLPASINLGIQKARAKYIVRVDSDDYVNTNFLYFLYYFLSQNSDMDAVACDYYVVDDAEKILKRVNCEREPIACGIIFKKEDLLKIGLYDEDFLFHEEREMRIRYEKNFKISRIPVPLYRYRRHDNNLTNDVKNMKLFEEKLEKLHKK